MRNRLTKIVENKSRDLLRGSVMNVVDKTIDEKNQAVTSPHFSSDLLFETLIENSPDIVTRFDINHRHVFINRAIEKYTGVKASEWIGKTQEEMGLPVEFCSKWKESIDEVFSTAHSIKFEFVFNHPDGKKYYDTSMVPEFDEFNKVKYVLSYVRDISPLKTTEQLLKSKNQELDTFIYKASHDLKGPLASIIGVVNVAQYEVKDVNALKIFDFISTSARRLDNLLKDLLQISLNSNTGLYYESIHLKSLIKEVLLSLKHTQYASDVDVILKIDTNYILHSDKKSLISILQNLIENSMKYKANNDDEKFIRISATQSDLEYIIEISDNGTGIPEEFQDRIFDMFYRVNTSVNGTGLGLFITKNSVNKLDGKISFVSKEGVGTTFTLKFPKL